jgi:uncharacterized protein YjiS (DUF1127 family)
MYCTEFNVLIEPRIASVHYIHINSIVPENTKISELSHAGATSACADGLALPRSNHWRRGMSATLATIVRSEVTKRANPFARIFSACCDWIARHFVRRTAIATFRGLDDRALRDIGIARFEIEAAVHGFITLPDQGRM